MILRKARKAFQETQIERKREKKMIEALNLKRELADKIIRDEEWVEIVTIKYSPYNIVIYNGRTGREFQLRPYDTEDDIRKIIEESYR